MINWKIRYGKILENNPELFDQKKSILEVGSGNFGISQYLKRNVVGLEPDFSGLVSEWLTPKIGTILDIDFQDDAFDYVVCVDTLEHLPKETRQKAINELIRVSKAKIIIACPCHSIAELGEGELANTLRLLSQSQMLPTWLSEHIKNGLPYVGDIFSILETTGFEFEFCGNEGMMQHYGGLLLDLVYPFSKTLLANVAYKTPLESPINGSEWDFNYSYIFTINKKNRLIASTTSMPSPLISIYSVYHQILPKKHLGEIQPIYVGQISENQPPGTLTDILQFEQKLDNSRWCELSAIYKIWREGPHSKVIGFCHYRRVFDFNSTSLPERSCNIKQHEIVPVNQETLNFLAKKILNDNQIVVPPPMRNEQATVWDQYCISHNTNDLCKVISSIVKHFPHITPHVHKSLFVSREMFANNMFIMSWEHFDELCNIWFKILKSFEATVPPGRSNRYQNRDISFLSERVFDIWIKSKRATGTALHYLPFHQIEFEGFDAREWSTLL